jgi:ectoine hydroxylase-related dioxygenase (phytanoyl-CoA dioxygenase family)
MNTPIKPLNEDQIDEFYREGYIVVKQLVPHEVIDSVVEEARKVPTCVDGSWTPKCFDFEKPLEDVALHQCLVEENVVTAVEQIFETRARAYFGMLAVVKAKGGKGLPWHQDNQYSQVLGRALNTFVALCDITPDKGILWVAPRSHLVGTQPSKSAEKGHREAEVEPEGGRPLPTLKKGDVCIFDRDTYHRSLKNDTNEDRYAYAAQYVEENARHVKLGGKKDLTRVMARELQATMAGAPV